MSSWLELLAERIASAYSETPTGHAARLNGLGRVEALHLCCLLRERLGPRWDPMVVAAWPKAEGEVGLDVAIERRNDKSRSRLFLVPSDLVSEAAASLADTESHEVTEYLKPIVMALGRKLRSGARDVAEDAMKWKPYSDRLDYLCSLPETANAEDAGRELWRLGMIPDFHPMMERIALNRNCAATLMDERRASASVWQRVEALNLESDAVKAKLVELLRASQGQGAREPFRRIAEAPELDLTFDRWEFKAPDGTEDLSAIEVHSFIDPRKGKAYTWSGLDLKDESLRVSTVDSKAKVTVRWSTKPEDPAGRPTYEVALETSEPQPVELLGDTQRHRPGKTQSWNFRPSEVEGIDGSLRVRVVVRCRVEGQPDPIDGGSDEFLLVNEPVPIEHASIFPPVRSLPDFLLERAASTRAMPKVTQCALDAKGGVKVELDERVRRRVPLNPVLQEIERQTLTEPNRATIFLLPLASDDHWRKEQLAPRQLLIDPDRLRGTEWWQTRRQLFAKIVADRGGQGIVESCQLADYAAEILSYGRGYAGLLEKALGQEGSEGQDMVAVLAQLDTVQLWQPTSNGEKQALAVLLSPLHPLRLLWHLAHEALVRKWIEQAGDRTLKALLPKPQVALELDGSNCPAFLCLGETLLYHLDSPFFHWPVYVAAHAENPHRIAALVRWGLGLGTLETLSLGEEVAAQKLAERLRGYAELHPHVRTLKVNAVNAGDGQLLVKALADLDEQSEPEPVGEEQEQAPPERAYEVRLYGPPPVHRIGAFLDDCASQRRRGQGLPQKLERLFRPGHSFLRPHLFWAKRELADIEKANDLPEEAHISFVTEYFRPKAALVPEEQEGRENGVSTYGLQVDLSSAFTMEAGEVGWVRTVRLPDSPDVGHHPADRRITRELLRGHRAMLRASARSLGGSEGQWPATSVAIGAEQFDLFARLHDSSDWVLTVDRNLGVDLFDSPEADQGELRDNARRYLIDYAPDRVGGAGQQLMISTAWVDEVSALLRETLREMLISPTDLACEEVLKLLKSVSGRLVMRVARYPQVAKEAVSLAVVRQVLLGQRELDGAFLVPVDEHIPIFTVSSGTGQAGEDRRPDLLLVRPRVDRRNLLVMDVIEVKYRRHRSMAYDRGLWADMLETTRAGEAALATYFPANPEAQLDLPLRRRQLKAVLTFYARRAVRHGLLDQETGARVLEWLDGLQRPELSLQIGHRGFVYCPELSFETEEQVHDPMKVTLIGRGALPRFTSFHPADEAPEPPSSGEEDSFTIPVPVEEEAAISSTDQGGSEHPAAHAMVQEVKPSTQPDPRISAVEPDRPTAGAEKLDILLGYGTQREAEVWFRPSIRGNPHALIVGIPGMGKTTALLSICRSMARGSVYPFVIDFHGDIASGLRAESGGGTCRVLDAAEGLPFNPLEVDPIRRRNDRGWRTHCFEVAEVLCNIYPAFGELQVGTLRETLRECYEAAGFRRAFSTAGAPRFVDFWRMLQRKAEKVRDVHRITARLESVFHLELFQEEPDESFSLTELLSGVTVLDLHGLELEENQRVAASFFLQRLYRDMFSHAEAGRLRNAIIFDEAHRVAKLNLIPKMMQECRKYGIMFVLSSQRVEDFNQGVLDSAGNHLYLRVNHPDARRLAAYIGAGTSATAVAERLENLPKYQALFRTEEYQPFVQVRLTAP